MHMRTFSGASLLALALLIAGLHYLANEFYLYWAWWWFDILMHFLGGALVAGSVLWLTRFEVPISIRHTIPRFTVAFLAVLTIGILWEVLEWVTGAYSALNYTLDTVLDIAMDIVGMLAAYLLFVRYGK